MSLITVIPYLSFNGQAEEAMNAYVSAFGGEIRYLSRWSKDTARKGEKQIGKVMHAEFLIGKTCFSCGDNYENNGENTSVKLMIHMENKERAEEAIRILAEGGKVVSPLMPHPKPDDGGCGSVTMDRFGYLWIITCPNPDKE